MVCNVYFKLCSNGCSEEYLRVYYVMKFVIFIDSWIISIILYIINKDIMNKNSMVHEKNMKWKLISNEMVGEKYIVKLLNIYKRKDLNI